VPQVRAPLLGANLGDTLPQFRVGVSSVHAEGSAALSGIRTVAFRHLQLLPAATCQVLCDRLVQGINSLI